MIFDTPETKKQDIGKSNFCLFPPQTWLRMYRNMVSLPLSRLGVVLPLLALVLLAELSR